MSSERQYSFRNGYRRALRDAFEYGHVCPDCAGPKSAQALRCLTCFAASLRKEVKAFESCEPVGAHRRT
jgi:hypothetical protein